MGAVTQDGDWKGALERAEAYSPFLKLALQRHPEITALLAGGDGEGALAAARAAGADAGTPDSALRRERLALALALAIGDLAKAFPLRRVMEELSDFADRALDRAISVAIRERVGDVQPVGFTALALGKHGACELNYSSDIDPILLYDPRVLPRRERDEPGEAAQRYARRLMEMLTTQTSEGYVFRVDLRLRPASEVSPLAVPFNGALSHYESSALAWERAAFIRARVAAGDIAAGEDFLEDIRPFVWRRSLDFTAIEEIRRLTARIRETHSGPREPGPGFDLKRGRGGIREIEFFAQTHQLIHGGRNPSLRLRGTRETLDALAEAGLISSDDAKMLGESYDRLRVIEHRLQMINDRQTHALPGDAEGIDRVARLDGLPDGETLIAELRSLTAAVAQRYSDLLGEDDPDVSLSSAQANEAVPGLAERMERWRGTIRSLRGVEARRALDAIEPDLVAALAAAPDPERALARWESLLERLPSAINLFRLFEARPGLLGQVLRALTLAPPLADALGRRAELLDALIDATAMNLPGPIEALVRRMDREESGDDYEQRLDRIRQVVGEERFALGIQLIEGRHDPLEIAAGLSRVAEAALQSGAREACAEFEETHGKVPGSELVVLGLGRLGGGILTHASDLDLVYLFSGEIGVESDGRRPLTASLYFNRLAQRVTAALSVPTAEGALYEVDTRLRPQGAQGPLAVSLESFSRYQREDAWTWEHMALCRARPLIGPPAARKELESIIREVLLDERDPVKLREDVLTMRGEISANKPPLGPLDAKLLRGGLVDCEFLVHYLQLLNGVGLDPELGAAIAALADAGLVPSELADHHAALTRLLVAERLLAPDCTTPPPASQEAMAWACRQPDYATLLQALAAARHGVAETWADIFGERLEIEE